MTGVVIWVLTVLLAGFFGWSMWTWQRMSMRLVSAILFLGLWFGVPFFAEMGLTWKIVLPAILIVVFVGSLVKQSRAHPEG